MPGAPWSASTERPESSAMAFCASAVANARALMRAFSMKVEPFSSTSSVMGEGEI